ncbi:CPBP family intramembrane metalloprotease [Candidatus Saccharibacteria bacterium]|nr:MAG: CPBP family intramembrane metalloprotease [Candidatus Saccharibacteria bacterium]
MMLRNKQIVKGLVIFIELMVVAYIVTADIAVATLLLLFLVFVSLRTRKQKFSLLRLRKFKNFKTDIPKIFALTVAWTAFTLGVVAPVLSHLFGLQQDTAAYASLEGNVPQMLGLLALTWTLVVFGEEIIYRSFIPLRVSELFSTYRRKYLLALLLSSVLFGLAHSELGWAGMIIAFSNGIYYSLVKHYFDDNLWASVLSHGFSNTIGIVGFFLIGPVSSFW